MLIDESIFSFRFALAATILGHKKRTERRAKQVFSDDDCCRSWSTLVCLYIEHKTAGHAESIGQVSTGVSDHQVACLIEYCLATAGRPASFFFLDVPAETSRNPSHQETMTILVVLYLRTRQSPVRRRRRGRLMVPRLELRIDHSIKGRVLF